MGARFVIPGYDLLKALGEGAYGEVWLARGRTGDLLALKIVEKSKFEGEHPDLPYEREYRGVTLFLKVARENPRHLAILHVDRNDALGFFWYTMELADDLLTGPEIDVEKYQAKTLSAELRRLGGRMPTDEVVPLGIGLATALTVLHGSKVDGRTLVHRDIKPSNIIYVRGVLKLADIGLVNTVALPKSIRDRSFAGTAGYVAPEGPGKPAADIYSLGIVLYVALTGQPANAHPSLPVDIQHPHFADLNNIMLLATEANPADRYATARALLNDLNLVARGANVSGWMLLRRQTRRLQVIAGILAVILVGTVIVLLSQRRLNRLQREALDKVNYTLATVELNAGRHARARQALESIWQGSPDDAPLQWQMLYRETFGEPNRIYQGPTNRITQIAVSADASSIAAQSGSGKGASLWSWPTNTQRATAGLPGVRNLAAVATDPPGLIWCRFPGEGALTNTIVAPFPTRGYCQEISRSADGNTLLLHAKYSSPDFQVRSLHDFHLSNSFAIPVQPLQPNIDLPLLVDHDSKILFFRNGEPQRHKHVRSLEVVAVDSGRNLENWPLKDHVTGLAASTNGDTIAIVVSTVGTPAVYHLGHTNSIELQSPEFGSAAESVAVEPNGRRVATGGTDGVIHIWDATSGKHLRSLVGHSPAVGALAWSQDGHWLVSGDDTGVVRRWDMLQPPELPYQLGGFWNEEYGDFRLGEHTLTWAATDEKGNVGVWTNAASIKPDFRLPDSFEPVRFTDHDQALWTVDEDGFLRHWNLDTRLTIATVGPLIATNEKCTRVLVDPSNHVAFALAKSDGISRLSKWDLVQNRSLETKTNRFEGTISLEASQNGKLLAVMLPTGKVICWQAGDFSRLWETGGDQKTEDADDTQELTGLAISADADLVAAAGTSGAVRMLSARTGEVRWRNQSHSSPVMALAFSPQSQWLVAAHGNGLLAWHDPATGQERVSYLVQNRSRPNTQSVIWRLAFAANGEQLVGLSNNGSEIFRWSIQKKLGGEKNILQEPP